jgi:hypothetical protein
VTLSPIFERHLINQIIPPSSIYLGVFLALFSSSQSAFFDCQYRTEGWGPFNTAYLCSVQNFPEITSMTAVQIDSVSGNHQAGKNNDNVEVVDVFQRGRIFYFPQGLTNFFKNLKGIRIEATGLKEIHQSDLKDYSKLKALWLYGNNLEVLEENLFEFTPNLEWISVVNNKITHVDPHVFDKLVKLNTLYIYENPCIFSFGDNDPTKVQTFIKAVQDQCTNFDYSNLEQKVKYLEFESTFLSFESLMMKFMKLSMQIKSSKFPNFFQERLNDIKAGIIFKDVLFSFNNKLDAQIIDVSNLKDEVHRIIDALNIN